MLFRSDACEAPTPIIAGDRLMGTTMGAADNHQESDLGCSQGSATGPEVVYAYRSRAVGQICASTIGSGFDTIVYVRRTRCAEGREVACNDDVGTGPLQSEATIDVVAGEQYFIFVDGFAGSSGAFVISVSQGACGAAAPDCAVDMDCGDGQICEGDACIEGCREDADCLLGLECVGDVCVEGPMPPDERGTCAEPIPVAVGNAAGTTVGQADAHQGSCSSAGGDRVHLFRPAGPGPICADTVGSGYDTALHVRAGDCDDLEAEVACNDDAVGLRSRVEFNAVEGTAYYIIVDGYNGEGAYQLNIQQGACEL